MNGARVNGMIDFTSGWLVANIGHDNRAVMRAVKKARGWAVIQDIENPIRQKAEETLQSILPPYLNRFAFYNSGSEAIDAAIRIAGPPIVTHERAFHGSTGNTQNLKYGPHFQHLKYLDTPRNTFLLETFLGPWCEWHLPKLIKEIAENRRKNQTIVMFDEMQAGFGRTGKWFGFEHYNIWPDIIIGGKAAAGGFPFAFIAGRAEVMDGKDKWESTFSGNALSCAAFIETVRQIRKHKLIARVCENEYLICETFPEAQGKGYAYAFPHDQAEEVVKIARKKGLLLLDTGRGTIKIAPPLCISLRDLWRGLQIIEESVEEAEDARAKSGADSA